MVAYEAVSFGVFAIVAMLESTKNGFKKRRVKGECTDMSYNFYTQTRRNF